MQSYILHHFKTDTCKPLNSIPVKSFIALTNPFFFKEYVTSDSVRVSAVECRLPGLIENCLGLKEYEFI